MKKGFGTGNLAVFLIIAIVVWKVVIPKFSGFAGDKANAFMAVSELKSAIDDIKRYYLKYGKLTDIQLMTSVSNFENPAQKLEINRPVMYGVRKNNLVSYCTILEIKIINSQEIITLTDSSDRSKTCLNFREDARYQSLKNTALRY
ncbi:hypothetical protein F1B92_04840 [Campylobacter sp. FMV-PI01]|uniref:Type II secretion system protein n=1 Tax=Campylobacter portucalensis TaxID=2608384 RepID=A0A6L5WHE3_9BACT|nr:hypothetical protein [Campylobacter portucalensis]MSN96499.1 hypothetical protein [Campylobacter portucalensis]